MCFGVLVGCEFQFEFLAMNFEKSQSSFCMISCNNVRCKCLWGFRGSSQGLPIIITESVSSNIIGISRCRYAIEKLTYLYWKAYNIYDAGKRYDHRQKYVIIMW